MLNEVDKPFSVRSGVVEKVIDSSTVVVILSTKKKHPVFPKYIQIRKKILAHVADGRKISVSDAVSIREVRKISKRKNWIVV